MIKYLNANTNATGSKSGQFANDQIVHHIAVSSQPQQINGFQNQYHFQNHGLNEMVNSTMVASHLVNSTLSSTFSLKAKLANQHKTEKESKVLDLEVSYIRI